MTPTPIFLLSLPRSGSTLLQRILSTHHDISTKSELWFLLPHVDAIQGRYTFSNYSSLSLKNANESLLHELPAGEKDYYQAIRLLGDHIYGRLAKKDERYLLDKTPRYYFIIKELKQIYPDAKFIFLFRNPLAIAASMVESFNRGRLGDHRHRIDLYKGPGLLAEGYECLKDRSIVVHYEDLLREPSVTVKAVCDYLEIPFHDELLTRFSEVPVDRLGDQFGSVKYNKLEPNRIDSWQQVFSTTYRKKYLLQYLEYLGRSTVETLGYDYDELVEMVNNSDASFSFGLRDRYDIFRCGILSMLEGVIFREKYRQYLEDGGMFFLLH